MKNTATSIIAKVAVLGAVAFVIMLAEIPLPFFPPFYKLDFSEVVVLMGEDYSESDVYRNHDRICR